jgi:hypothetical protein
VRYLPVSGTSHQDTLDHGSSGALPVTVALTGSILTPGPVVISATALSFTTTGLGLPSAVQDYDVSGSNLVNAIAVTAPAPFEVSLSPGGGFGVSVTTAAPVNGSVPPTTVYVRYRPPAGTNHAGSVDHTSSGLPSVPLGVSGSVVPPPTMHVSVGALVMESAAVGEPSPAESYSVSGSGLTAPVTITTPADFEISLAASTGFSGTLMLPAPTGTLAPTTVFVRYVPATSISQAGTLTHASTGAVSAAVALDGRVIEPPPSRSTAEPGCATRSRGPGFPAVAMLVAALLAARTLSRRRVAA